MKFKIFLQNNWANFNQTWHKSSVGEGGFTKKDHSVLKKEIRDFFYSPNQRYDVIIVSSNVFIDLYWFLSWTMWPI